MPTTLNDLLHTIVDRLPLPSGDEREQLHADVDEVTDLPAPAADPALVDTTKAAAA